MTYQNFRIVMGAFLVAILSACAPVEYADEDATLSAMSFTVEGDKSRIYVFRDDDVVINTPITISIDGQVVGVTGKGTFIAATVEPGSHTVTAKAENTDDLVIEAGAGEVVFVEVGVGLGAFTNRANLMLAEPERGKAAVSEARLVK